MTRFVGTRCSQSRSKNVSGRMTGEREGVAGRTGEILITFKAIMQVGT